MELQTSGVEPGLRCSEPPDPLAEFFNGSRGHGIRQHDVDGQCPPTRSLARARAFRRNTLGFGSARRKIAKLRRFCNKMHATVLHSECWAAVGRTYGRNWFEPRSTRYRTCVCSSTPSSVSGDADPWSNYRGGADRRQPADSLSLRAWPRDGDVPPSLEKVGRTAPENGEPLYDAIAAAGI